MAADDRSLSVYFKDTSGNDFYDSLSDINPSLNADGIRKFASQIQTLTDGDLVKTVQSDKTVIYPSVPGGE